MRVYRVLILILLASLTVILLGTAVYALQTPPPAPISHVEEDGMWRTAVYPDIPTLSFPQDDPAIVDILP